MRTGKKVSLLALIALLVSGLLITSCPEGETKDNTETGGEDTARQILATVSPVAVRKTLAEWTQAPQAFNVTLSESSAESYQWYSKTASNGAGTLIAGKTAATFTPEITAVGDYYYYVVVKVDGNDVASNNALVRIFDPANAADRAPTQFTIGDDRVHYVRGVGGTGSFMFREGNNADASPDADVKYIDLLMKEMGCNILRIMVQDDYKKYINNTIQSRNGKVFFHDARANFFAVIRRVNELGGYVFANPWTAPADFKTTGKLVGTDSKLKPGPEYSIKYAEWLTDFLKWLNQNNAPIFALGILNEPDWGDQTNYEGMGMSANDHRNWFKLVKHLTTENDGIIPGYGGGKATHHVLVMTGDSYGPPSYFDPIIDDAEANKYFEILGRHWYAGGAARITKLAGSGPTTAKPTGALWKERPDYSAPDEAEVLSKSPHMFAPGSQAGKIKREIWQTEHDFNYWSNSTNIPGSNPQRTWSSAFAAMNDVDWAMRVVHESVFDWWFSSSYSGLVTSYQGTPANGNGETWEAGATEWPPYTYTPRGRAFAHYARYINETWSLPIKQEKVKAGTNMTFNQTGLNTSENVTASGFNAGSRDPKISAFEDVNGEFISIVMFTPNLSTNGTNVIGYGFGSGGTQGTNDPTDSSANVGRVEVVLPERFKATSASALRSYGWRNATGETWDDVPKGSPRYWIDEPVFLLKSGNNDAVEVTLPGGNIISIMVKGTWTGRDGDFLTGANKRVRPYKFD